MKSLTISQLIALQGLSTDIACQPFSYKIKEGIQFDQIINDIKLSNFQYDDICGQLKIISGEVLADLIIGFVDSIDNALNDERSKLLTK